MENIIKIITAAQAREAVKQQADVVCERVWSDILCAVRNSIHDAIEGCKCCTYLSESIMRGVSTRAVFEKLHPMLTGMGYQVEMGKYAGIRISWEEGVTNESQ